MKEVKITTDGSCDRGVGGYCAILSINGQEKIVKGKELNTTNNRMELTAAIVGLEELKEACNVTISTDSEYVQKGMEFWVWKWIRNSWKTIEGKDVKNKDLWERLLKAQDPHKVKWIWVRGHNGDVQNERCDKLANEARSLLENKRGINLSE